MKMKTVSWWEYDCPECDTSNALPNPPFPATHYCRECGRLWDVHKLRVAGFITLQQDRIPA
jgi:DNA primase large subunit